MILAIPILLFSIIAHEFSHGWVADKLGDSTPKLAGRLTLNPLKHLDLFGTFIMPVLLIVITGGRFAFGYAKPIPINPNNFKKPKKDIMWVGISGPFTNFILALILAIFHKFPLPPVLREGVQIGVFINLLLCIFNLVPIPPLDGSKIVTSFLSYKSARRYLRMQFVGFAIIILLIFSGFLQWCILPLVEFAMDALGVETLIL